MEPSSLGAMRQYQIAKQALSPDANKSASVKTPLDDPKPNAVAEGVKDFAAVLENVETQTQAMAMGEADAHSVVQAMAQAEVALETAVTIRNRVVEAYQELLRMPI
jgi:flagellar hook-basal body complex protein FliE